MWRIVLPDLSEWSWIKWELISDFVFSVVIRLPISSWAVPDFHRCWTEYNDGQDAAACCEEVSWRVCRPSNPQQTYFGGMLLVVGHIFVHSWISLTVADWWLPCKPSSADGRFEVVYRLRLIKELVWHRSGDDVFFGRICSLLTVKCCGHSCTIEVLGCRAGYWYGWVVADDEVSVLFWGLQVSQQPKFLAWSLLVRL